MNATLAACTAMVVVLAGCGAGTDEPERQWVTGVFDRFQESARGTARIFEIQRSERLSVLRSTSDHYGGAVGGGFFVLECLGDLCAERGFPYYVILEQYLVENEPGSPTNHDAEQIIGFVRTDEPDIRAEFPEYFDPDNVYPAIPADFKANIRETMERLQGYMDELDREMEQRGMPEVRPSLFPEFPDAQLTPDEEPRDP